MQFSLSFYIHFLLSFVGFLFVGIYLCRGTWRNLIRAPMGLAAAFIVLGHIFNASGPVSVLGSLVLIALGLGTFTISQRNAKFVPSEVRQGHNVFSLLVGAALFALTVQLHALFFGVPVFQLVK
jgi:hypothetical protein